ncbi:hypothetical protein [Ruminococcus sp.]|uniref:hypothetical protein n=1 Tax=Ruminococcus sp. TaxID=41978 RepID=UPI0025D48AC0|nr:hypothetical protein [Ruminococcus sp.]MBQ8967467.1 hypothetical protein [Ruminococcus sp.]
MQKYSKTIAMIENDLLSKDTVAQAYAIRACCISGYSSPKIISALKLLTKSNEKSMWQNISDMAIAALHLIGAEKYSGNNSAIKELIKTKDFSII